MRIGALARSDRSATQRRERALHLLGFAELQRDFYVRPDNIEPDIAAIRKRVDALNLYVTEQQPWALAKDPEASDRLATVLSTAVRGVGALAILLSPVLPKATARLWEALGADGDVADVNVLEAGAFDGTGRTVTPLDPPLFPRVETLDEA